MNIVLVLICVEAMYMVDECIVAFLCVGFVSEVTVYVIDDSYFMS